MVHLLELSQVTEELTCRISMSVKSKALGKQAFQLQTPGDLWNVRKRLLIASKTVCLSYCKGGMNLRHQSKKS